MQILNYPRTKVIYGFDSIKWLSNIKEKEDRIAIVTTRSLIKSRILEDIQNIISGHVIIGPRQHTPEEDVINLQSNIAEYSTIIGLGGGSIIDGLKLAVDDNKYFIVIPTTFSGAEHTNIAGFTSEGMKKVKQAREADVVILDPKATLETPKWLLLSTAIRALDHAIEAIYSTYATPFIDALATEGYIKLISHLRKLESLESRLECQIGVWLSSLTIRYVKTGISHIFGYVFGPRFNIPHGITSCISLPEAIKLNYDLAKNKLRVLENEGPPLYKQIESLLINLGIKRKLSEFTTLPEALKFSEIFVDLVNNSGNPLKVDRNMVENFIKNIY